MNNELLLKIVKEITCRLTYEIEISRCDDLISVHLGYNPNYEWVNEGASVFGISITHEQGELVLSSMRYGSLVLRLTMADPAFITKASKAFTQHFKFMLESYINKQTRELEATKGLLYRVIKDG